MGSIPEELLLARIRRETEAREAAFAALQAALDKATGAIDQKILVAASKFSVGSVSATAIAGTILRTQVEAGFALAEQVTELEARFNDRVNSALASITETRTALADATQAFAQQTLTLQTQFNASSAKFTEQITALSTDTQALTTRTTTLESTVNNPTTGVAATSARLTTEETTRATADTALSSRATTLESTVNNATTGVAATAARLTTEETTRANADAALSTRTTTLESTVNDATTGVAATSARLTTEETTRATADSALSSSISTVSATANSKNKTFTQGSAPTASAVGDLWVDTSSGNKLKRWNGSAWVDTDVAIGAINAAVTVEATARADADTALSSRTTTLESTVNNAVTGVAATAARLTTEETTRANADSALSSSISTVSATANAKNRTFVQSSAPTAQAVGDLWIDTGNGNALKRWDGSAWVDTTVANGAINAAVTTEATARANADSALSTTITTLTATVGTKNQTFTQNSAPTAVSVGDLWIDTSSGNKLKRWSGSAWTDTDVAIGSINAAVSVEATARANADSALSTRTTTLESTVNDAVTGVAATSARLTTEETTRANADSALSSSISTVSATANTKNRTFVQSSAPTAAAVGDIWVDTNNGNALKRWDGSTWADTTVASGAINAAVTTEATARANADTALSTSISNVSATVGTKNRTFYQSSAPTATAVGDLWIDTTGTANAVKRWDGSNWVDTQVAAGAIGAAVTAESSARATADGFLSGKYSLKVIAGNVVTGMNITSSSGGGTDVSDITFQGANFKIHNGSTGVVPFSVNTLTNTVTLTNVVVDTLAANIQITTPKILGATLKFNGSSTICCDTNDGSDNGILRMNGGGADGVGRGGQIDVIGNEYSTNASYAGAILITPGNAGNGAVYIRDRTTADRIKVDTGGNVVLNGATATNIYNASFQTAVLTDINLKGTKLTFADTGGTARIDMQESWGIKLTRSSDQHHFHTAGTALVVGSVIAGTSLTGDRIYFGGSGVYLYESGGVLYLHDGNGDRALT